MVRGEVEPRGVFGGGSLSKNRKKNPFLEKPVREYILDIVIITQHYKKLMYQTQIQNIQPVHQHDVIYGSSVVIYFFQQILIQGIWESRSLKIVLHDWFFYDFGQVCELKKDQAQGILEVIEAIMDMNAKTCVDAFGKMGVLVDGANLDLVQQKIQNNFDSG